MNKEMLYRQIGLIADDLIEEASESDKKSLRWQHVFAACAAVAAACVMALFIFPIGKEKSDIAVTDADIWCSDGEVIEEYRPSGQYELYFNQAKGEVAKMDICLGFSYELTEEQKSFVFPGYEELGSVEGTAAYDMDAQLRRIFALLTFSESDTGDKGASVGISIYIGVTEPVLDVWFEDQPQPSYIANCEVVAGSYEFYEDVVYFVSFMKDGMAYSLQMNGEDASQETVTLVAEWIICSGEADISVLEDPVVPELRDDELTKEQAYSDVDFGAYMPVVDVPGIDFETARRYVDQNNDYLSALWSQWRILGLDEINITVRKLNEDDRKRIVAPGENERYDLALYPIPRAESVPDELWEVVNDPVFRSDEITIEEVYARSYYSDEVGDEGYRIDLSVLYGDVIVKIRSKGPTPEDVYKMLVSIST